MTLAFDDNIEATVPSGNTWRPSRAAALQRLTAFLPLAGKVYASRRNFDLGPGHHQHVSALSPWIRHRLVLESEVAAAVLARHRFQAAEKFIQEVCWRSYWKGWLELRPSVWDDYRYHLGRQVAALQKDGHLKQRYQNALAGETGIDCFDAWAHELTTTGYLHNHARMWFASIWIFNLGLPWELGADFFLGHLLDGDAASNTLSWRWVAGLQTAGKEYRATAANIQTFTDGRFDPTGQLTQRATAPEFTPPPAIGTVPQAGNIDPAGRTGLLISDDDLGLHDLALPGDPGDGPSWQTVLALNSSGYRSPLKTADQVRDFTTAAIGDALTGMGIKNTMPTTVQTDFDCQTVLAWARQHRLSQVVWLTPTTGPTQDRLANLAAELAAQGCQLVRHFRPWDRRAWPHATHGFFRFKKTIPSLLEAVSG